MAKISGWRLSNRGVAYKKCVVCNRVFSLQKCPPAFEKTAEAQKPRGITLSSLGGETAETLWLWNYSSERNEMHTFPFIGLLLPNWKCESYDETLWSIILHLKYTQQTLVITTFVSGKQGRGLRKGERTNNMICVVNVLKFLIIHLINVFTMQYNVQ